MRIPLDLIAAVLCIEGIERYLDATPAPSFSLWTTLAFWVGFWLCIWLLHELLARALEWRTRFGLRPAGPPGGIHSQVLYNWGTRLIQTVSVLLFCGLLYSLRWPLLVQHWPDWFGLPMKISIGNLRLADSATAGMLLNIFPFVVAMILGWLPRRRLFSGLRRRPISLRTFLADEMRLSLLPLVIWLILSLVTDLLQMLPAGMVAVFNQPAVDLLTLIVILAACAFVLLPKLIIWLWQCKPLPDSELKERLQHLLRTSGVKARDILQWGPRHSHMLNACVLGPWSRYRYVLISRQLVDELGLVETDAVLAHELGHARYGHLTLLFVMLLFMSALWLWISQGLTVLHQSPLAETGASIIFITLYIWAFFGAIMRLCEREADLASAETMGTPVPLINALERLAALSGDSRTVYSWHHGSIAQRVTVLERLAADPKAGARLHKWLRRMRWLLITLTALALGGQIWRAL